MTAIDLRIGDHEIRVSANRRVTAIVRDALLDQTMDHEAPIGFQVRALGRIRRRHILVDRCGFVLGSARHADAVASMLLSHLTALADPTPSHVRFRARALLHEGEAVLCLHPLLFIPLLDEDVLIGEGCTVLDALAFDIEARTGRLVRPTVSWTASTHRRVPRGHMSVFDLPEAGVPVRRVVIPSPVGTPAQTAGRLVEERLGVKGAAGRATALAAARALVDGAELVGVSLWDQHLVRALVGSRSD